MQIRTKLVTFASALAFLLATPFAVQAGCHINLTVKNGGKYTVGVNTTKDTAAKGKGGAWRALKKGGWKHSAFRIKPGHSVNGVYKGIAGCKHRRRYRVRYTCTGGKQKTQSFVQYFPSANGWTRGTSIIIHLDRCKK